VTDTVDAFIKVAESQNAIGQVLNSGSNTEVSVARLIDMIQAITQKDIKVVVEKRRLRPEKSEVERLICDATKIREACGWTSTVSLNEGVKLTCEWIYKNMIQYKTEIYNV